MTNNKSARSNSACKKPTDLITLRVDVTDGPIRVVDTVLFDPSCWPLPLASVEQNATELAHHLVSDLEVHGMGRTARHFTARVDFYSKPLLQKVARQLQSQLEGIRDGNSETCAMGMVRKKQKIEPTIQTSNNINNNNTDIIKVNLRMSIHGIMVMDNFDWDTTVPTCPLLVATQLTKDLNLPEDGAVAIATSIIEQLNEAVVSTETKEIPPMPEPTGRKDVTSAWTVDPR